MIKFKDVRFYFIASILILAGLIVIFNKVFTVGLIILGAGILVYALWEFFLKEKENKIDILDREIQRIKSENLSLKEELNELSNRKLNISEVNDILDLGLIEVNTNFKRTINKNLIVGDKTVQFIGVLHVDFIAKYGVDFRKLKYRIDEERHEINIANADPQFLSFSKRNCTWEIAEILEYNEPFFGANHWKTNPKLDKLANEIKEEFRIKTERETESGPNELDWVITPLKKHVETALELIFGIKGYIVRLTQLDSGNYKPIKEFTENSIGSKMLEKGIE
jgi:hypothetical protein